jgi:triosephosphate isomerase
MRIPFIAGNWKMYKTVTDAVKYVKELRGMVKDVEDVEIVLAPMFTALHAAAEAARNSNVGISAQDLYWEREGAFTGEVSGPMIREAGAEYVNIGLEGITGDQLGQLVIAYEPVWAIGTGRNATPAQAGEAHAHIRKRLQQWFGNEAADACHVIYGGSVKPDNIRDLVSQPDVDGALVGGASLEVRSFFDIVSRSRRAVV